MRQLKFCAWDLDGTLYQANPELDQAIQQALYTKLAETLNCPQEEAVRYYRTAKSELKSSTKVLNQAGIDGRKFFLDLWLELPLESYIAPNLELRTAFENSIATVPGLQHVLFTNSNNQETVERKLRCLDLPRETFTHVFTSVEMQVEKPDLRAFEIVLSRLQAQSETVLYVGDRVEVDLLPAKKVGMYTCLVTWDKPQGSQDAVDLMVQTPNEVFEQLQFFE